MRVGCLVIYWSCFFGYVLVLIRFVLGFIKIINKIIFLILGEIFYNYIRVNKRKFILVV